MYTEPNMGLTVWNLLTDLYDHAAQANNIVAIGAHDHSGGKGVQIGTAGIANGAITGAKIANSTITGAQMARGTILTRYVFASGGPVTAVVGDFIGANGGVVVTLPVPPVAGGIIGVYCGQTNGLNQVQIKYGAGAGAIVGVGMSTPGVKSFGLGTPYSSVTLTSDGTNWIVSAGQRDTGWIPLTLPAGISASANYYTPSIRLQADTLQFKGQLVNSSGGTLAAGSSIGTVPFGLGPPIAGGITFATAISGGTPGTLGTPAIINIDQFGNVVLIGPTGVGWVNTTALAVDGLSYNLSSLTF